MDGSGEDILSPVLIEEEERKAAIVTLGDLILKNQVLRPILVRDAWIPDW